MLTTNTKIELLESLPWSCVAPFLHEQMSLPVRLNLQSAPQTGFRVSGANSLSVSLKLIKLPAPNNPTLQPSNIC